MLNLFRKYLVLWFLKKFKSPSQMFRFAFKTYADQLALITPKGQWTYAQLEDRVLRLVAGFVNSLGLKQGDIVFTMLNDGNEQIEMQIVLGEFGGVIGTFNHGHSPQMILEAARMVQPGCFVYDPEIGAKAAILLKKHYPNIKLVATGPDESYEQLIKEHQPLRIKRKIDPDKPAALGFTSGTTGKPKMIYTTSRIRIISLRRVVKYIGVLPRSTGHIVLGIPLVGAGSGTVLPAFFGGSILVLPKDYSIKSIAEAIEHYRGVRSFITPSQLIDLLDLDDLDKRDLSSLTNVVYGTETMAAAKLAEAIRHFGPIFQQGYGMAEVLPPVSVLQMKQHGTKDKPASLEILGSAGWVVPDVKVVIKDEEDRALPPGKIGICWISAPTMFNGYWQQPDLNESILKNNFMNTRDYAYLNKDGLLYILNRTHDVIKRDNKLLFPRQIEEITHEFPAVKEACLVEAKNQVVLAISLRSTWRKKDPESIKKELMDFLKNRLAVWQMPEKIIIMDELPRSILEKLLRREVREQLERS